jgi:hypothetical protein
MERGMRIEETIERTVAGIAEHNGWITRKLQWIGRKGAPDRLFLSEGRAVFIEFKDPEGGLELLQEREIARLKWAGLEVHTVNNIMDGLRILGLLHRI